MACRLFDTKPTTESMIDHCHLTLENKILGYWVYKHFFTVKEDRSKIPLTKHKSCCLVCNAFSLQSNLWLPLLGSMMRTRNIDPLLKSHLCTLDIILMHRGICEMGLMIHIGVSLYSDIPGITCRPSGLDCHLINQIVRWHWRSLIRWRAC